MKTSKIFITISFLAFPLFAEGPKGAYVASSGGLFLRSAPAVSGKPLILMPKGAAVTITGDSGRTDTIEGIRSRWLVVRYKDLTGFAFGGYLATLPAPTGECQSLAEYWENTLGIKAIRTFYQVAEKNGQNVYSVQEREYVTEPSIDYTKQMVVLQRSSVHPNGSTYKSTAINGAGTARIHFVNASPREAYLIMGLCLPKDSTPKLKPYAEFMTTGKQCFFTREAVYMYGIIQKGTGTEIVVSGALGTLLDDCHQ